MKTKVPPTGSDGPDSITNIYDLLKWSIPHLKKFPRKRKMGHPLKGESREKTPLLPKKFSLFAWLKPLHQHGLVFTPFRTRYFFSLWFWSRTDPHQSPIGIKAFVVIEAIVQPQPLVL